MTYLNENECALYFQRLINLKKKRLEEKNNGEKCFFRFGRRLSKEKLRRTNGNVFVVDNMKCEHQKFIKLCVMVFNFDSS